MKKSLVLWMLWTLAALAALPLFAAPAITTVTVDRQAALDAVVAAEKAFARTAAEKGTREAFLQYLSDDSVLLAPGPVPGKEMWKARPAPPSFLSWYPVVADVSLAGDLGWDTGPWQLRPKGKADKNVLHGFFITLWRKQADGSFKAELDGGGSNAAPPPSVTAVKIPKAIPARVENPPQVDPTTGQALLLRADRALAKTASDKGFATALADVLTDDARLHREGAFPVTSKKEILATLNAHPAKVAWLPLQARVASSADLGYTIGKEQVDAGEGHYLRIWKKQGSGPWKVVLDAFYPLPPAPETAKNPHTGH
jgi:ketosteroid isomerase-like protein